MRSAILAACVATTLAAHAQIPTTMDYKMSRLQDDGLAITPPMGWRSWNCFGGEVTDSRMRSIADAMVDKKRVINGVPTSLADLGYIRIGLDDNYQACGTGIGNSFHDARGNPLINAARFPNLKAYNDYIHSKKLLSGWYHNNCICRENNWPGDEMAHYMGDVNATVAYEFDEVKLDGCGQFLDLNLWSKLLNATGRKVLIENCHWGADLPTLDHCPFHFYRTSGDISASYSSMFRNLQTTRKFQDPHAPLSRPGCWAYPDMLEVGNLGKFNEERSHFGAWVIVSSPLILSFDLTRNDIMDRVWPIISNKEAIAINQAWFGHPGRLIESYNPAPNGTNMFIWATTCSTSAADQQGWSYVAATGQIKFGSLCVDSVTRNEFSLRDCTGSATQKFQQGIDGSYRANTGDCMDVYDFDGPSVELYMCNGGCNQKFTISNGRMSTTCAPPVHQARCFAGRSEKPGGGDLIQIWAKPVSANGNMAVLVMNSDHDTSNHVVTIDLHSIGFSGTVSVRDVWTKSTLGTATGTFVTDKIPGYDSRLYVFSKLSEEPAVAQK